MRRTLVLLASLGILDSPRTQVFQEPPSPPAPHFEVTSTVAALAAAQGAAKPTTLHAAVLLDAFLACGSDMRRGPHRNTIKQLAVQLRPGPSAEDQQAAPLEMLLTADAFHRAHTQSNFQLIKKPAEQWIAAACARATDAKASNPLLRPFQKQVLQLVKDLRLHD